MEKEPFLICENNEVYVCILSMVSYLFDIEMKLFAILDGYEIFGTTGHLNHWYLVWFSRYP
jgi:hypothetical protein